MAWKGLKEGDDQMALSCETAGLTIFSFCISIIDK